MNGVVIFKGRYGATAQYAQWIGEQLNVPVFDADIIDSAKLNKYDVVVIGTSVYVGRLLVARWMKRVERVLSSKKVFLFVVCGTPPSQVQELNKLITTNISPAMQRICKTYFLQGRMIKSELSLKDRIVLTIGAMLQKSKEDKARMLTDFDQVKRPQVQQLIHDVEPKAVQVS